MQFASVASRRRSRAKRSRVKLKLAVCRSLGREAHAGRSGKVIFARLPDGWTATFRNLFDMAKTRSDQLCSFLQYQIPGVLFYHSNVTDNYSASASSCPVTCLSHLAIHPNNSVPIKSRLNFLRYSQSFSLMT